MKLRLFLPVFLLSAFFVTGCCQDKHEPVAKEVVVTDNDLDKDGVLNGSDACPNTPTGAEVDARGCWVLKGVNFENNSDALTAASNVVLDKVAKVLANNPSVKVLVEGHTDGRGDASYNESLSQRRADSVKAYLVGKGTSSDQLSTKGYGLTMPIATNDTREGRAANRRVELSAQ